MLCPISKLVNSHVDNQSFHFGLLPCDKSIMLLNDNQQYLLLYQHTALFVKIFTLLIVCISLFPRYLATEKHS